MFELCAWACDHVAGSFGATEFSGLYTCQSQEPKLEKLESIIVVVACCTQYCGCHLR